MKIILVPDSFKGTMSSAEVCAIMTQAIRGVIPAAQVLSIPVADGGEGTVDAFLAASGGERVECAVNGPFLPPTLPPPQGGRSNFCLNEIVPSFYGILGDGKTAVIEMAAAAGLPLAEVAVREGRLPALDPEITTTYGVGELVKLALDKISPCASAPPA
jgi:glycerate kinase